MAERFFQHDAGCGAVQPGSGQMAADGHEIVRRSGKVNHQGAAVLPGFGAEQRGEVVELFGVFGVYGQIVDALAEGVPRFGFEVGNMRPGGFLYFFQVAFAPQIAAAKADDAAARVQRTGGVGLIEGGQQLAHHEVAGAAEEDDIERGRHGWIGR